MTNVKSWLTALLAVQLLLAGSLLAFNYQRTTGTEAASIFDGEVVSVDRLEISDGETNITVNKNGDQWQLPEQDDLLATESKVSATIDSVAAVEMIWPVSTTGSSHERFEVAADNYQREVKLFAGNDQVAHFYLGTSPGFRKVHMRQADSDAVYAVNLNTFDFPVTTDQWLEKSILNVTEADIIAGPDFSIEKEGEDWAFSDAMVDGDESAPTLNLDKAKQLATALSNFRVSEIADAAPDTEPTIFTVTSGDNSWEFTFYQAEETFYVRRNDFEQVFTVSKYDYERLAQVNRQALVLEAEEMIEVSENIDEPLESDSEASEVEENTNGN